MGNPKKSFSFTEKQADFLRELLERQLKFFESRAPAYWAVERAQYCERCLNVLNGKVDKQTRIEETQIIAGETECDFIKLGKIIGDNKPCDQKGCPKASLCSKRQKQTTIEVETQRKPNGELSDTMLDKLLGKIK